MEALLSRYRNLTVLLIVVFAQLLYLAYQVRTNGDERLIRVWAVTAVTPMAGVVEAVRRNTIGFLQDYFILLDVREQNRHLKADNDHLRMENVYFRNQLSTAEHAHALIQFQSQSRSKTVAARVIGNSTVVTAKAVFIDRGSTSQIEKGMAVVTPEGIVGKVVAVYPLVSQVLLITDPTFKVGIESQHNHVHGVLDCGSGKCQVQQIQNEEKVDVGEWFFTSGEDRVFPKGFPVGTVVTSQPGQGMREIRLNLSGAPGGAEEVLVVLQGVHQNIPTTPPPIEQTAAKMLDLPPGAGPSTPVIKPQTEADKIVEKYQSLGKDQGHVYGGFGSPIPNFNLKSAAAGQGKRNSTTGSPVPTSGEVTGKKEGGSGSTPSVPVPGNSSPQILGARPAAPKPPTGSTTAPEVRPRTDYNPALPLGAPRRKPKPTTGTQLPSKKQEPPSAGQ
ncbi:MAG: rod shape-determining protein MreC [Bryobacteraceae bacterium]